MSSKLKPLDLTSAGIGFSGSINFNQFVKFQPNDLTVKAHVWLFNESGCGLDVVFKNSGNSHYLPAGGWGTFDLEPNDGSAVVTVTYTLPNPPVSSLNAIYYAPGEKVPGSFTLGNSPIGIGGSVSTSAIQTLSNEGNAANTLVVDIGDTALSQLMTLFTDHFVFKVDQSGVAHAVIKSSTSGNAAQIGQTGDTSEVVGSLLVDQAVTVTGNMAVTGTTSLDASNITTDGVGGITMNGNLTTGTIHASEILFNVAGGMKAISRFGPFTAGTTGAAFAHGLGVTPTIVICTIQGTAGGAGALHNVKVDDSSYTSTQFTAIADAANISFYGIAIKF